MQSIQVPEGLGPFVLFLSHAQLQTIRAALRSAAHTAGNLASQADAVEGNECEHIAKALRDSQAGYQELAREIDGFGRLLGRLP